MPYRDRDPEPFTVVQIINAFNSAVASLDKPTYTAAGFDIIGNLMRDVLHVPVKVTSYCPEVRGLRIVTRWGTGGRQTFTRPWNRGGFELEGTT